jgi:hypothetical protein
MEIAILNPCGFRIIFKYTVFFSYKPIDNNTYKDYNISYELCDNKSFGRMYEYNQASNKMELNYMYDSRLLRGLRDAFILNYNQVLKE